MLSHMDLDATDQAYKSDPYAIYAELSGPPCPITLNGLPAWLVTRYADVREALANPNLSNSLDNMNPALASSGAWVLGERMMGLDRNLLRSDPPVHTRLRRAVSDAFTPAQIAELRPRVQEMADSLVGSFLDRGEVELISEFAFPLPLMAIVELLGMPLDERDDFHRWVRMTVPRGNQQEELAGYTAIRDYFTELVERKIAYPEDDLLSSLATHSDLDAEELLGMAWLLLTAGHTTTVDLIGNGMLTLLRNPSQLEVLSADLSLLPAAIEEFARYDGAIELGISRFTTAPVTLGGVTIPGDGQAVLLAFAAAGRDQFPDGDTFDIRRAVGGHLGFGHGPHYCLGASLARMEATVAFRTLLTCASSWSLATTEIEWQVNPHLRGPAALPLRFVSP